VNPSVFAGLPEFVPSGDIHAYEGAHGVVKLPLGCLIIILPRLDLLCWVHGKRSWLALAFSFVSLRLLWDWRFSCHQKLGQPWHLSNRSGQCRTCYLLEFLNLLHNPPIWNPLLKWFRGFRSLLGWCELRTRHDSCPASHRWKWLDSLFFLTSSSGHRSSSVNASTLNRRV
jgi:hypothetical protein